MAIAREINSAGLSALACQAITGSKSLTVTAAGGTQAAATALTSALNIVTTCVLGANGVILPVNEAGDLITVSNTTAANLYVYPPVGGAMSGGTANIPWMMAPNWTEDFLQTSALNYTT